MIGVVVTVVMGALYYARTTPRYQSNAEILVVKRRPEVVTGDQYHASRFDDYVSTHTVVIKSPLIIARAIEASNLRSLKTFSDVEEEDLTQVIIASSGSTRLTTVASMPADPVALIANVIGFAVRNRSLSIC